MRDGVIFYQNKLYLREVICEFCRASVSSDMVLCTHQKTLIDVVSYYGDGIEYPSGRGANRDEVKFIKQKYYKRDNA